MGTKSSKGRMSSCSKWPRATAISCRKHWWIRSISPRSARRNTKGF